ncbi:magnesium transporter [Ruminococcus sp.]|uniref:magnesium transporter n=1 Tax=Ruminococcus sp. TaxID=41978 RepID=UPI0025DA6B84|nr:magnesium transporter [Ruminococcus sp.]
MANPAKNIKNISPQSGEITARPDYVKEIREIVKGGLSPKMIQERLDDYHEKDIAEALTDLERVDRVKILRILDADALADIFEYVPEEVAGKLLEEMDIKKAVALISELESDSAVDILRTIPRERRTQFIDLIDDESKRNIELVASFDEDEIGSRMTSNFVQISNDMTVKSAMSALIEQAKDNDNITTIFVADKSGLFYGAIDLTDLIIARQDEPLEDIISTSFPYVYGTEEVDSVIESLKDYSENSIPVLDNSNHIIGVITSQNLVEVVDDEMGEDYAKLAGLTAEEDLAEPLKMSIKKRLPWLLVLLGLGMIVSSVVGIFEQVIAKLTIIMAFQSLILDMSGNVGTQSLAVTIRVLTDENLSGKQKLRLVTKEMKIGLTNGLILGVCSIILIGLYIMIFKGKPAILAFGVSFCIGAALILAMLISSAVGTVIPLFFKKIKIDPAVASGPLITTVCDLVSVVTYYGLSWILLINVLGLG